MDYKKLLNEAGYDGDTADYIARKLEARKVPKENLNALGSYFPGMGELAGEPLHELGMALHEAAHELGMALHEAAHEADATEAAKELAKKEKVNLKNVTGSGSGGRITKTDVESEVEDGNS